MVPFRRGYKWVSGKKINLSPNKMNITHRPVPRQPRPLYKSISIAPMMDREGHSSEEERSKLGKKKVGLEVSARNSKFCRGN